MNPPVLGRAWLTLTPTTGAYAHEIPQSCLLRRLPTVPPGLAAAFLPLPQLPVVTQF
jgi:hypothetical protein